MRYCVPTPPARPIDVFQPPSLKNLLVSLDQTDTFDEVIDVRTPLEFAEDHMPGALNAPVLSNDERVIVGTMYAQVSAFEATKVGAAMVARNIAAHLDSTFADRPRNWRPLIYCWRGGKRSGSMTTWLNLIGWQARQLDGGYKTYRHGVIAQLGSAPPRYRFIVLAGDTGSGKTRLLQALAQAGEQVLDLEAHAAHRGSLLGAMPDRPQPSQKAFETALAMDLARFDPARPVFTEAESRRIGQVSLPQALLDALHRSECVTVVASMSARVQFLLDDYGHLFDTPDFFKAQLARMIGTHSRQRVADWQALIDTDARAELFEALVAQHYDPAYARSSHGSFTRLPHALSFCFDPIASDPVAQARDLVAQLRVHRCAAVAALR